MQMDDTTRKKKSAQLVRILLLAGRSCLFVVLLLILNPSDSQAAQHQASCDSTKTKIVKCIEICRYLYELLSEKAKSVFTRNYWNKSRITREKLCCFGFEFVVCLDRKK